MQVTGEFEYFLLGASRGLGNEFGKLLNRQNKAFLYSSRKESKDFINWIQMDFSRTEMWDKYLISIQNSKAQKVIYFAAGGPYGLFQEKKWSDHLWAWNVSFLFPAHLIHYCLNHRWPELQQVIVIGSKIAESSPDAMAASYSAAKHALKGLVDTIALESLDSTAQLKINLFSPGYMLTDLLPKNSWPRESGQAESPAKVAQELYDFVRS